MAILSALIGSAALVYAQEEKQQEEKPARQEEAKPQPKQDEAKPSRQNEAKPSNQDTRGEKQDQQRGQEQSGDRAKPQGQERPEMQGDRNKPAQERPQMHSEQQGDHGRKGGHIPDDRFHAQFGREHHFNARTVIVQGRPQFQYGGYNFELVDVWPSDWAYTDDCYIDYIDGNYYLIDLVHPGIRLAVFVVM
jgi:DNA mismatch repair ATPase MutL